MSRPVIGISAAIESARWTVWEDVEVNISQRTYSTAVADAGAIPMILPPTELGTEDPGAVVDLLDGLVLAGGADIDPAAYGVAAEPATAGFRPERDRFELAVAHAALGRDMPVLGVCRGMELLNVACGGTLIQHLPDADVHLHTPGRFGDHHVSLERDSLAARVVGSGRVAVRSHHHQGIDRLGAGVVASGWAEPGGAIEAIELPEQRWALGVLWHAEEERPSAIFQALAEAASRRVHA